MNGENANDKTNRLLEAILLELQDHGNAIREIRADIRVMKEDIKALTRRVENLELVVVDMNRRLENVERAFISFSGLFKDVQDLRERVQRLEAKVG